MLFTGDFKFARTKLLEPALTKFQRLETLMMESTYGASEDIQPTRAECEKFLVDSVTGFNVSERLVDIFAVSFLTLALLASVVTNVKDRRKKH